MTDVPHDLRSLRHLVDSPLSSKVAMFNNQVQQHQKAQLLNPFSQIDGRASPKPTFSKDEYGKPLAGSLTEMRGNKANIHVLKEMLELCQIIHSEGYTVNNEPTMRVIPFGELFNIYNYISDKVVGILLRARKHKLVEFEGEMLYQRRDDNVPIFLLKPIAEIRTELQEKVEAIKRAASPAPQATTILLDKRNMNSNGLKGVTSMSRSPSPAPCNFNGTTSTPAASKVQITTPGSQQNGIGLLNSITSSSTLCNQDDSVVSKSPLTINESTLQTVWDKVPANQKECYTSSQMHEQVEIDRGPCQQLTVQINLPDTPTPQQPSIDIDNISNYNNNDANKNQNLNVPVILLEENTPNLETYLSCESLNISEIDDTNNTVNPIKN